MEHIARGFLIYGYTGITVFGLSLLYRSIQVLRGKPFFNREGEAAEMRSWTSQQILAGLLLVSIIAWPALIYQIIQQVSKKGAK